MLEKYRGLGLKRYYLIFGMCDESFSINCSAEIPEGVDRGWFYFWVTLLNHAYWVTGATLGDLVGALLSFDTTGLDFVMTAMFVVIVLEQWGKEKGHLPSLIGLGASGVCLALFGADSFLLPAMGCILALLTVLKKPIDRMQAEGGRPHDPDATDHYHRPVCAGHPAHPVSVLLGVPGRSGAGICSISGAGPAGGHLRHTAGSVGVLRAKSPCYR